MDVKNFYEHKSHKYALGGGRKRHILDLVSQGSGHVLDVGCANGALASILKERGYQVTGIDISSRSLGLASRYLEDQFCFNVEDSSWPDRLLKQRFDLIIASEIIEHIFDPEMFLKRAKQLLMPGGKIIITTPNFLFWKNRLNILRGRFHYTSEGLLDYGHIRFFTVNSVRELFYGVGLDIEQEHHFYPNLYHRGLEFLGRKFPSFFAYQMIFLLQLKDEKR